MTNIQYKRIIISALLSIVLIIGFSMLIFRIFAPKKNSINFSDNIIVSKEIDKNIQEEINYISDIYEKNKEDIGVKKEKRIEDFKENIKSGKQKLLNDKEITKISLRFPDTVVIGDSFAEQLKKNIFTDSYHVKSHIGANLDDLGKEIESAKEEYPKNIILLRGLNDVACFPKMAMFVEKLAAIIIDLKESLPDSNIYVCSILPPSDELLLTRTDLAGYDNYNKMTELLCEKLDVNYVDISFMITSDDMRYPDGMHFKNDYYNYWIQYMDILVNY